MRKTVAVSCDFLENGFSFRLDVKGTRVKCNIKNSPKK